MAGRGTEVVPHGGNKAGREGFTPGASRRPGKNMDVPMTRLFRTDGKATGKLISPNHDAVALLSLTDLEAAVMMLPEWGSPFTFQVGGMSPPDLIWRTHACVAI